MNRESVHWRGYIPAISTPFTPDGELDRRGWAELLDWMVSEGMHGVIVAGTTGEWFSLQPEERIELFRIAGEVVAHRIPVLAGCSAFTAKEVVTYAEAAHRAKVDGVLVTPPPYVVPTRQEIIAFYRTISDQSELPLCIYNWPRGTGIDMDADLVCELAELDCVVGIKNSTGDTAGFLDTFYAVRDQLRYFGFPMNELGMTLVAHAGGDGTMGAGAVLGHDHPAFYDCIWAGDLDGARRHGARDRVLMDRWLNNDYSAKFGSPQAQIKAALDMRGLPGGPPRPPLMPLDEDGLQRVSDTLRELDLAVAA